MTAMTLLASRAQAPDRARPRRPHLAGASLVMLAPVFWLVASSLQNDGQLARGSYDLLHPTFAAFREMWKTIDFERYFINSAIICTTAALLATAFAAHRRLRARALPLPRRPALRPGASSAPS